MKKIKNIKRIVSILVLMILSSCSNRELIIPSEYRYEEIKTSKFKIASWQKSDKEAGEEVAADKIESDEIYKIYIEGDGHAFNARGYPTRNPTPRGTLLRELAFKDKGKRVIYLGRPCQFVEDRECEQKYWSTGRFSPEVISSMAQAVEYVSRGHKVKLIGYSGGAQVSGLIALKHPEIEVEELITISGNLDSNRWIEEKKLTPLKESLSLSDYKEEYSKFKQRHYIGGKDKVIPPHISYDYIKDKTTIRENPTATHSQGWETLEIE